MAPFTCPVPMLDGTLYTVKQLLGRPNSNTKIQKSNEKNTSIRSVSLSLAPATVSGFNLCTSSSAGCRNACLFTAGHAMVHPHTVQPARIAKSRMLRLYPDIFHQKLFEEIRANLKTANKKGQQLFVRLNTISDVMWEREFPQIFREFPTVQFYDYTKHYKRMLRRLNYEKFPANYHLTFSYSGTNLSECLDVLGKSGNVAVVFHVKYHKNKYDPLPERWHGHSVIDGDVTDLRPLDPQGGRAVGLRAKGKARNDTSSFVESPSAGLAVLQ